MSSHPPSLQKTGSSSPSAPSTPAATKGSSIRLVPWEKHKNSKYFLPNRTQPFIITFFMAVLAFRKLCKQMRRKVWQHRTASPQRRRSVFLTRVKQSRQSINLAMIGRPVINTETVEKEAEKEAAIAAAAAAAAAAVSLPSPAKARSRHASMVPVVEAALSKAKTDKIRLENLNRDVSRVLESYHTRVRNQTRMMSLEEKLDNAIRPKPDRQAIMSRQHSRKQGVGKHAMSLAVAALKANDGRQILPNNSYFKSFADAFIVNEHDEPIQQAINTLEVGEYLEGTPIYFGATISLQARHGGYLSYNNGDIKASAHKILSHTRFIIKKSDDLTDIGMVKYGDALWLQTSGTHVLGAQYGSLVDQKREIQPALVSCKRTSMFKAQQYGRWIILNRDDPMGTLGKSVGHLDKLILEQEWFFLASQSPSNSSLHRMINNSDEAMTTKVDLFRPPEECVWKMHLVALPSDDGDDERHRQQLLQDAKDQIDLSNENRYKKSLILLNSLQSMLPLQLQDDYYLHESQKMKSNENLLQHYYLKLYKKLESNNFENLINSPEYLAAVYGKNSKIVKLKKQSLEISKNNRVIHKDLENFNVENLTKVEKTLLENLNDNYWEVAFKLLVNSLVYAQLPRVMNEYKSKDAENKERAARTIQAWFRSYLDSKFDYFRAFRKIDKLTQEKLIMKDNIKKDLVNINHSSTGNNNDKNNNEAKKSAKINKLKVSALAVTSTVALGNSIPSDKVPPNTPLNANANENDSPANIPMLRRNSSAKFDASVISNLNTTMLSRQVSMSTSKLPSILQPTIDETSTRPQTAPNSALKKSFEVQKEELRAREGNIGGLPADVFEGLPKDGGLKTGVKFLKVMSNSQSHVKAHLFDDLHFRKRPQTSGRNRSRDEKKPSKEGKWTPVGR